MAGKLREPISLPMHEGTLTTGFRLVLQNKNLIRHDRISSVYLPYRRDISSPIHLILFGGCSPPKTHTSIAAFEASQFPQLRGLFI